ncbi:MAG: cytochrome c3 family protein, partial [Chloroflexota bacterium]
MQSKKLLTIIVGLALFALPVMLGSSSSPPNSLAGMLDAGKAVAAGSDCLGCHADTTNAWSASRHATIDCVTCHEGSATHLAAPTDVAQYPKVHFDMEICKSCHNDQYNSFMIAAGGRTIYGGSDGGPHAPKGWSKTSDLPYWNVLIDGHPFVLET